MTVGPYSEYMYMLLLLLSIYGYNKNGILFEKSYLIVFSTEKELGGACTERRHCADANALCDANSRCSCDQDFYPENNVCMQSKPS